MSLRVAETSGGSQSREAAPGARRREQRERARNWAAIRTVVPGGRRVRSRGVGVRWIEHVRELGVQIRIGECVVEFDGARGLDQAVEAGDHLELGGVRFDYTP